MSGQRSTKGIPELTFRSAGEWERWLAGNAGLSDGVWLRLARKGSGETTVTRDEALEVALCYGWIDSQAGAREPGNFWRQRFGPRRARSVWSQVNCAKAESLVAAGRMTPAGQREIDRAKADGRWARAYAPQRTMEVPDDLARALAEDPAASAFFGSLDSRNRYAILYRLHEAKRPETRQRRLESFLTMLREGRKLH